MGLMKIILVYLNIIYILLLLISFNTEAIDTPTATAAILIDGETGQILYEKNSHLHRPPASLTKILTAIIAIEEGNLQDRVKVSQRAVYQEGSSIYLEEGEELRLEELLYAILLASGNDASVAIAEHISGSVEKFALLMNKKARDMGAISSNFLNPSGLPQAGHISTAYDLAMIMRYSLKNSVFSRIISTKTRTISWDNNEWGRGLRNHNKLLWSYEDITGGKTGYTKAAGRCLLASARKGDREVIAVVLNCPDDWLEVRNLLNYGLNNFKQVNVINKGEVIHQILWEDAREGKLSIMAGDQVNILIPSGGEIKIKKELYIKPELKLPIKKGEIIGYLKIYSKGELFSKSDLIALNDLNYNSIFLRFWSWLTTLNLG